MSDQVIGSVAVSQRVHAKSEESSRLEHDDSHLASTRVDAENDWSHEGDKSLKQNALPGSVFSRPLAGHGSWRRRSIARLSVEDQPDHRLREGGWPFRRWWMASAR